VEDICSKCQERLKEDRDDEEGNVCGANNQGKKKLGRAREAGRKSFRRKGRGTMGEGRMHSEHKPKKRPSLDRMQFLEDNHTRVDGKWGEGVDRGSLGKPLHRKTSLPRKKSRGGGGRVFFRAMRKSSRKEGQAKRIKQTYLLYCSAHGRIKNKRRSGQRGRHALRSPLQYLEREIKHR